MPQIAPIILAVAAVASVGLQIAGNAQAADAARERAQFEQQIARDQQRQEALRQQQMELDNRRKRLESVRQAQRARAAALATTTAQGADSGSALGGAYGQIGGQEGNNLLGLSQSLILGRANFGLNSDISSARYGIAGANADYATGQGLSSLGGAIMSSLGPIGNLSGGFFPGSNSYGAQGGFNNPYLPFGGSSANAVS